MGGFRVYRAQSMPNGGKLWQSAYVSRPTHPKTAHLQVLRR